MPVAGGRPRADLGRPGSLRRVVLQFLQADLTLTATGADKGVALRVACDELGIDPHEVVAFGDAENDIEMFAIAGRSYAMGQASDKVKSAATEVTASNLEDGVALAIEELFG